MCSVFDIVRRCGEGLPLEPLWPLLWSGWPDLCLGGNGRIPGAFEQVSRYPLWKCELLELRVCTPQTWSGHRHLPDTSDPPYLPEALDYTVTETWLLSFLVQPQPNSQLTSSCPEGPRVLVYPVHHTQEADVGGSQTQVFLLNHSLSPCLSAVLGSDWYESLLRHLIPCHTPFPIRISAWKGEI